MTPRTLCAGITLALCSSVADASVVPAGTLITASAAQGLLYSSADGYADAANPASAALSGVFGEVEFVSDDFGLAFDFLADGTLQLYGLAGGIVNRFEFSFDGLPRVLHSATLAQPVAGLGLEVIDHRTLRLTVDNVDFPADGSALAVTIGLPEPAPAALLAAGLLALALRRRVR